MRPWPAALAALLLTGCVSGRQYRELQTQATQQAAGYQQADRQLRQALQDRDRQEDRITLLTRRISRLTADSLRSLAQLESERAAYTELAAAREQTRSAAPTAKAPPRRAGSPNSELEKINRLQSRREADLRATEKQNTELITRLRTSEDSVILLLNRLRARDNRNRALEQAVVERDKAIAYLRQQMAAALNDLSLGVKDGKLYLSLSEKLVDKMGSLFKFRRDERPAGR